MQQINFPLPKLSFLPIFRFECFVQLTRIHNFLHIGIRQAFSFLLNKNETYLSVRQIIKVLEVEFKVKSRNINGIKRVFLFYIHINHISQRTMNKVFIKKTQNGRF